MNTKSIIKQIFINHSLFFLLLSCIFLFCSCGYQIGRGESTFSRFETIAVPYVKGDIDGSLTSAIVQEIVSKGAFEYREQGNLILNVIKAEVDEDNIGFRYDRKKRGTLTKDVIPTETRVTIYVEITLTEALSCRTVLGPVRLSASVDYDHDYYSSRDGINIFSLGQLSDLDAAYDAVQEPLYRAIAEKIVDYITQSW